MTEAEARAEIEAMTEAAMAPTLSPADIDLLVRKAKRADSNHRVPSDPAWVPTWNVAYAIALGWRMRRQRITGRINYTVSGMTVNRAQFYDRCRELEKEWRTRGAEEVVLQGAYRQPVISTQTNGVLLEGTKELF